MAAFWICLCAFLNCAGWVLSAFHTLNATGYVIALVVGITAALFWLKPTGSEIRSCCNWRKLRRRFRSPFPLAFLVLAVMAFLGGVLHPPSNYDGLAYRVPRVLHWLAEDQWHWIHTDFHRLNVRTSGIEWLSAPLIALTRTDRLLFLINAVSFGLLPGLIFSVFTRVGVKRRVARHWMWVLPTGYCFLLQAGSIANDLFGAVFVLAAVDFALRAQRSAGVFDVCLSILAAALATSAKATNLPLLLPWMIALVAVWRVWLARPLVLAALMLPAIGASFLPTALLNLRYCGDWTGRAAEPVNIGGGPAWLYLLNNGIMIGLESFVPPVFPLAAQWNAFTPKIIPEWLAGPLNKHFEEAPASWKLGEMQTEETAGLGFGVSTLFAASLAAVLWRRNRANKAAEHSPPDWVARLVCTSAWVSLAVSLSSLGLSGVTRYCAPYYALLLMGFLRVSGHSEIVRSKWWRGWSFVVFGLAGVLLVLSQARPLWPAQWVLHDFRDKLESSRLGSRILTVYEVYGRRADAFGSVRKQLPPDASPLGIVTFDDPETSLWRPFGSRRIVHVVADETAESVRQRGIKYVFVSVEKLREPWEVWLQRMNGRVLQTFDLRLRAGREPFVWRLVEIIPADQGQPVPSSKMKP
jgi:hypothetical protein